MVASSALARRAPLAVAHAKSAAVYLPIIAS